MALDPPPAPDIVFETREVDRKLPSQALVEKVEARKRSVKRRKKTKRKDVSDQGVPREVGGTSGYMSEADIHEVHEKRRRRGLSTETPVTVTDFLEATEWKIPRELSTLKTSKRIDETTRSHTA